MSNNPKLNNVLKGWHAATHDWIIIADSNVLMPRDYIERLFASWRTDTGLVASPPIGSQPDGFWAELECAFLNTYQARWQYIADAFGFGFAQGKTMLWRRADLERAGGIEALGKEVAEDAAATKIVRGAGLKVRLVDRPFAATARPPQRRRSLEPAGALGAAAPRKLLCLFPAGDAVRRRAADDRASRIVAPTFELPVAPASVLLSARSGTASEHAARGGRRLARFGALSALRPGARSAAAGAVRQRAAAATTSSGAATKCRSSACGPAA